MVFHKCHANKFNLYNQVGLIALNCMGEPYGYGGGSSGGQGQAISHAGLEDELQMDKATLERLR